MSSNKSSNFGLCFCFFVFLRSGITRAAGGVPIRSRAMALTASTARNRFGFFLGMAPSCHNRWFAQIGHYLLSRRF
jgi:hypothetical protein